jgi:hypothetical protein
MQYQPPIIDKYVFVDKQMSPWDDSQSAIEPVQTTAALPLSHYMDSSKGMASLDNYGVPVGLVVMPIRRDSMIQSYYGGGEKKQSDSSDMDENIHKIISDHDFDKIIGVASIVKTVKTATRKNRKEK